jgi:hypothetical protein
MIHARHHSSGPWYIFASVFPFVSILTCWFFFYSLHHSKRGRVLTISETVIDSPESRIFAGTMHIEALVLFLLYGVRNRVISLWSTHQSALPKSFTVRWFICRVCAWLTPISLSFISIVTLNDQEFLHFFGAILFFYGTIIYCIVSDSCLRTVGRPPARISAAVSWAALAFALLYPAIFALKETSQAHWKAFANSGAVIQYLAALTICFKILLFYYDAPPHRLTVIPHEE